MTAFANETASLGYIKTLTINPGRFRTEVAAPHKHSFPCDSQNYQELSDRMREFFPKVHGNQPGDPAKAAEVVIDLVKGEGVAAGREVPRYLPLGTDSYDAAKGVAEGMMKTLQEWEEVIRSTDY